MLRVIAMLAYFVCSLTISASAAQLSESESGRITLGYGNPYWWPCRYEAFRAPLDEGILELHRKTIKALVDPFIRNPNSLQEESVRREILFQNYNLIPTGSLIIGRLNGLGPRVIRSSSKKVHEWRDDREGTLLVDIVFHSKTHASIVRKMRALGCLALR